MYIYIYIIDRLIDKYSAKHVHLIMPHPLLCLDKLADPQRAGHCPAGVHSKTCILNTSWISQNLGTNSNLYISLSPFVMAAARVWDIQQLEKIYEYMDLTWYCPANLLPALLHDLPRNSSGLKRMPFMDSTCKAISKTCRWICNGWKSWHGIWFNSHWDVLRYTDDVDKPW